jgi:hypothetical protein
MEIRGWLRMGSLDNVMIEAPTPTSHSKFQPLETTFFLSKIKCSIQDPSFQTSYSLYQGILFLSSSKIWSLPS